MDTAIEEAFYCLLNESVKAAKKRESATFDEIARPLEKSIVLFGAGFLCRKILRGLIRLGVAVPAVSDNDPSKWGRRLDGIEILPPERAAAKYGGSACFVVAVFSLDSQFDALNRQLTDLGCSRVVSFVPLFWKFPAIFYPDFFISLPHEYLLQQAKIKKVFSLLADEESRRQFVSQLRFRMSSDFSALPRPSLHDQYFPAGIISLSSQEVFIDCGAYDGDSIKSFLQHTGSHFKSIFAYEPDPSNFELLSEYRAELDDDIKNKIFIKKVATSSQKKQVRFEADGTDGSFVCESGGVLVGSIALDEELMNERPTFIKLDVEGAEMDTLMGAQRIITAFKPVIAASVYHKPGDLWDICLYLHSLCSDDYKFHLKTHRPGGRDIVLYAVPRDI